MQSSMLVSLISMLKEITKIIRCIMVKNWLISDLIPKKSEKLEFWKNFVTIFFSVEN